MRLLPLALTAGLVLTACGPAENTKTSDPAAISESEQLYSCGMHPHVLEHEPGECPICGMNLTPVRSSEAGSVSGERKIKYWVAPMDPSYISDTPGKSPMGMDLVPVYEDEASGTAGSSDITIDPAVVQNMGVRTEIVRRQTVFRHVRSIGQVEVGEDQVSVVNLRFSGWIEKIHVDKTGDPVKKGEPLFEIYSPDLVAAQEEYLLARRTQGAKSALARSARRKFELWELADEDILAIARAGQARRTVTIRSPRSGFVLHKNVVEGARVAAGQDLYRIGDLTRIWVTAEVYEFDVPWVEVGQPAQMELSYEQGQVLEGEVAYIYPTLNETSRTLTVRLEFENRDLRLKPGMFATVYIQYRRKDDVIAVPTEAILDSGRRKLVFVVTEPGHFAPREIVSGLTGDHDLTEVVSGIAEGDEVVVSGQFLIDSESQLQEAIRKMRSRRGDGRASANDVDEHVHEGVADEHARYACPMHPEITSDEPGSCPVCGMFLEKTSPTDETRP